MIESIPSAHASPWHSKGRHTVQPAFQASESAAAEAQIAAEVLEQELKHLSHLISHDLTAPLRHLNAFGRLLSEHTNQAYPHDAKLVQDLGGLMEAVHTMHLRVRGLQSWNRLRNTLPVWEQVPLATLVDMAVQSWQGQQQAEIPVQLDLPAPWYPWVSDQTLFALVLRELLDNAWRFSQGQANPRIELSLRLELEGEARPYLYLEVRDHGIGFQVQQTDRLFQLFQVGHAHSQCPQIGQGVGLALVKRAVEQLGGLVTLSRQGTGHEAHTVAAVLLPQGPIPAR